MQIDFGVSVVTLSLEQCWIEIGTSSPELLSRSCEEIRTDQIHSTHQRPGPSSALSTGVPHDRSLTDCTELLMETHCLTADYSNEGH